MATLAGLDVPNVAVTSVTAVPAAGMFPEFCDVQGTVATQGEGAGPGAALFDLWLPAAWNHRFLFLGCGSFCGSLSNISANGTDFAEALDLGYATVHTDTGHTQLGSEPTWALLAPGVPNEPALVDFRYRAVHQVTVAAKHLVSGYYGRAITYAYFDGCSRGGGQSLIEGDRYPEDFDGLIAGAPLMDSSKGAADLKEAKAFLPRDAYLPFALLPMLDAAVNANCDAADGVADGLIQNPAQCSFDPQALVPAVLTQAQADALELYLTQLTDTQGTPVYPGRPIGHFTTSGFAGRVELATPAVDPSAAEPWGGVGIGPTLWTGADAAIRYFVELDPTFDVTNDWPQTDAVIDDAAVQLLRQRFAAVVDPADPQKLADFFRQGRKLILYHGFSDPQTSPYRTIWFYKALAEQQKGYKHLQEQARLFMVPGMGHCGDGPGPNSFDTLRALDKWVSQGRAPEALIATNTESGRTMPLCTFPEEASYAGSGDVNQAAHWTCHAHDKRLLQVGRDGILAGVGGDHEADHNEVNHEDDK
jgi:feruloyl esterase